MFGIVELLSLISLQALCVLRGSEDDRPILGVLMLSSVYYGLAGPLFWIYSAGARYVDVQWQPDDIVFAALLLNFATLLLMVSILWFSARRDRRSKNWFAKAANLPNRERNQALPLSFWMLLSLGLVAS